MDRFKKNKEYIVLEKTESNTGKLFKIFGGTWESYWLSSRYHLAYKNISVRIRIGRRNLDFSPKEIEWHINRYLKTYHNFNMDLKIHEFDSYDDILEFFENEELISELIK